MIESRDDMFTWQFPSGHGFHCLPSSFLGCYYFTPAMVLFFTSTGQYISFKFQLNLILFYFQLQIHLRSYIWVGTRWKVRRASTHHSTTAQIRPRYRRRTHKIRMATRCLVPCRQVVICSCLLTNARRNGLGKHSSDFACRLCSTCESQFN